MKGLAAIGDPLYRPLHFARRPGHQRFFGIDYLLAAKAATDVRRHHAQLALGNAEDQHSDQHPRDMRKLGRGIERVVARGGLVLGNGRPRFHGVRHQPVVDEIDLGDVMRHGEGGVGCGRIADRPIAAEIAGHIFIELGRIGRDRSYGLRHNWQNTILDGDALDGAAGRRCRR